MNRSKKEQLGCKTLIKAGSFKQLTMRPEGRKYSQRLQIDPLWSADGTEKFGRASLKEILQWSHRVKSIGIGLSSQYLRGHPWSLGSLLVPLTPVDRVESGEDGWLAQQFIFLTYSLWISLMRCSSYDVAVTSSFCWVNSCQSHWINDIYTHTHIHMYTHL